MRILQVNAHHRKVGGAEVYVHQLMDALRGRGHEVALFAQDGQEEHSKPELCVVRRPDFDAARLILDEALFARFREFARRFRPDVVHVHNLHVFPAVFPRVLAELGVPLLLHPHEFGLLCPNAWCVWPDGTPCSGGPGKKCFEHDCSRNYPIDARNVMVARLRHLACRETSAAVVCGSDALANLLRENGYPDVRTLRYFAEPAKFGGLEALAKLRRETPREREQILFLGRLEPEKGIGVLLAAMPAVLRVRPNARLRIVGGGSQRAALEAQAAALGLGQAVELPGPVPHDQVPPLLARATLQVLPSIWAENAAQSCYDCLMLGLPLVASRVAALPEVVRHEVNGLLFAPRDPADLARQILRILDEPGLGERLSAGCAGELARYDKRAHLDALEALFAELVARRAPQPAPADAEMEFTLEQVDGLLLSKERAYLDMERELGRRGEALAAAELELERLRSGGAPRPPTSATTVTEPAPAGLRGRLRSIFDRFIDPAESA